MQPEPRTIPHRLPDQTRGCGFAIPFPLSLYLLSYSNCWRSLLVRTTAAPPSQRLWQCCPIIFVVKRKEAAAEDPVSGTFQLMFDWLKKSISSKPGSLQRNLANQSASALNAQDEIQRSSAVFKNRGDECLKSGAFDEAVKCYRQAIAINPRYAEAHSTLGDALRDQGKINDAFPCYRNALELAPDLPDAHFGLGVALMEKSDFQNAAVCFENALALKPDFVRAHNSLGFALIELSRPAEALARFQHAISLEPENGMARHLIASLTRSNPERAPGQYIEKLFDGFANTFDSHLQSLKYETPRDLLTLIAQRSAPASGKWDVLDLGCGTGLVGLAIAPYASQLVGVDLSARMLEKAQARNLYHRLEHLDLLSMMQDEQSSSYDIVIAADSLIYLGKLDDVVREATRLLRRGGLFAFSVEALEALPGAAPGQGIPLDYLLQKIPSCRYAHSSGYISRLASDNEFKIQELKKAHIRNSSGSSVQGYLVLLEN
jgi:predicted TPR repeat methyltransferase